VTSWGNAATERRGCYADFSISVFRRFSFCMVMQEISPLLWFDGQAEEPAKFYVSVFNQGMAVD